MNPLVELDGILELPFMIDSIFWASSDRTPGVCFVYSELEIRSSWADTESNNFVGVRIDNK